MRTTRAVALAAATCGLVLTTGPGPVVAADRQRPARPVPAAPPRLVLPPAHDPTAPVPMPHVRPSRTPPVPMPLVRPRGLPAVPMPGVGPPGSLSGLLPPAPPQPPAHPRPSVPRLLR